MCFFRFDVLLILFSALMWALFYFIFVYCPNKWKLLLLRFPARIVNDEYKRKKKQSIINPLIHSYHIQMFLLSRGHEKMEPQMHVVVCPHVWSAKLMWLLLLLYIYIYITAAWLLLLLLLAQFPSLSCLFRISLILCIDVNTIALHSVCFAVCYIHSTRTETSNLPIGNTANAAGGTNVAKQDLITSPVHIYCC